jgi:hypothetical protein
MIDDKNSVLGGSRSSSTSESDGVSSPQQPEPPDLDRTNDNVYNSTTSVVRSVMTLTKEASSVKAEEYTMLVKVRTSTMLPLVLSCANECQMLVRTFTMLLLVLSRRNECQML